MVPFDWTPRSHFDGGTQDCTSKAPHFGLPSEGRKRWCSSCARQHYGAVNVVRPPRVRAAGQRSFPVRVRMRMHHRVALAW